ncbi:SPOR domain-containing protein [Azospirillum thermophilum]|uniref:SPOR domain-containing protein n=1 Tax=Azospirillum thermophilum TaxID=2202148 RepID=A0A2S2CKV9_9PROT|nr:SPOR domain-containing protein [Azospirillum thermophilum]AWK85121.1 SPOR domain-containing protein [Azospirillum thermophilum]
MKYEGDVNYATDPYGYRPAQAPNRRGLWTLGFAVVGIVAFAGTILVAYRGGDRLSADGTPPLLTADPSPAKSRPEQPGGLEVPHQDKLVYQRLNERTTQPNIERLLPPPETPLPRPVVTPSMPSPPPLPSAPSIGQLPPGSTATVPREQVEAPPAGDAAASAAAAASPAPAAAAPAAPGVKPAPAAKPAAPVQSAALPSPPPGGKPAAASQPAAPPAAKAPAPAPQAAAPQPTKSEQAKSEQTKPAAAGGSGGWRVQLASVKSETEAAAEWKRLAGKYGGALGGLSFQVARVDLGEKGIFYRVQGGGLDETRAKSVCAQLRSQNVGCVVVRP